MSDTTEIITTVSLSIRSPNSNVKLLTNEENESEINLKDMGNIPMF